MDTKRQISSTWNKSYAWYPVRRAARDPLRTFAPDLCTARTGEVEFNLSFC
jgi:hypothetical protein